MLVRAQTDWKHQKQVYLVQSSIVQAPYNKADMAKQVRLATLVKLSHLRVAGLIPGHDNLWKPFKEYAAIVRLCMIVVAKKALFSRWECLYRMFLIGHFADGLSMVSVRVEPPNRYETEGVQSSAE